LTAAVLTSSRALVRLTLLVAALTAVATLTGLLWRGGDAPATVVSVHGETVDLYGEGLYRHDSVFKGAGNRGTDAVTLALGVPLLVAAAVLHRRGSLRGTLLLVGTLASWTLYLYGTMAVGTAHNELFLVYVALLAASLYGLIFAMRSVDTRALAVDADPRLPRRSLAAFMIFSGCSPW
jgi:hypothetical protein